jgi:hypothetical protein
VRQSANFVRYPEPLQNRPARWIEAIAAHFLARKGFTFEENDASPGPGGERGTATSSRTCSDYSNVVNAWKALHFERLHSGTVVRMRISE